MGSAKIFKVWRVSDLIVTSSEKKTYNYFLLELSSLEVCGVTHNTGLKTKKITVRWGKSNERRVGRARLDRHTARRWALTFSSVCSLASRPELSL